MSKKYRITLKDHPRLQMFIIIFSAVVFSVLCFWMIFNLKIEAIILPNSYKQETVDNKNVLLKIPSAGIDVKVVFTEGTQEAVDKNDVVWDSVCENIRLLGHADKSFKNLSAINIDDDIYFGKEKYRVFFSSRGIETEDNTNVTSSYTGQRLLGKADMELITCVDDKGIEKWIVLAKKIK